MLSKVFITCALTGNIVKPGQHPHLPITPAEIATAGLEAAAAGAAIVHVHVRDPKTGLPSGETALYREVMERIREKNSDLIINLTTGYGGRFVPSHDEPKIAAEGTTLIAPEKRVEHVALLKPDICTLDLNTMNSGGQVVINTPQNVTRMAKIIREAGVKPEIELFDSGDIHLAKDLIKDGILDGPGMYSIVVGVKYGFDATPDTMLYARDLLPAGAMWTGFGLGRMEFPMAAQSYLLGGQVRVGFEDNIYISKGQLAPNNAALVERAKNIIENLGAEIATAKEARVMLNLTQ